MPEQDRQRRFELLAMPHLDAAYNLARWLAGNAADADDLVQDAYLRAFRHFDGFRGGDMRVWLLTIVRRGFFDQIKRNRGDRLSFGFDATQPDTASAAPLWAAEPADPETLLLHRLDERTVAELFPRLPAELREVLLLREVEDMPYRDIAAVAGIPVGTVMSRLSRARAALRLLWRQAHDREAANGV